jgi:hypothetical protein
VQDADGTEKLKENKKQNIRCPYGCTAGAVYSILERKGYNNTYSYLSSSVDEEEVKTRRIEPTQVSQGDLAYSREPLSFGPKAIKRSLSQNRASTGARDLIAHWEDFSEGEGQKYPV